MKKSRNINNYLPPLAILLILLCVWQAVCSIGLVPPYLLPSPIQVIQAFIADFPLLMSHLKITLFEAMIGLSIGIILGFICAVLMDQFPFYKALYPLLILTQTIPTVAIAPLLILWLGYDMAPKIVLVVIVTFSPIAVNLYEGFQHVDSDQIKLFHAMGATEGDIFKYIKLPGSLQPFFGALKISVSYSIVGAVISEWLGGFAGLGVYMTKVKKSYSFDKMFAVIFLISILSLFFMF